MSLQILLLLTFSLFSHLTSSCLLHTRWRIRTCYTTSICLSLATVFVLAQLFISSSSLSVSTVLLQVVFGRSTLRFSSGCHVDAVVQILLLSTHKAWFIYLYLFCIIISLFQLYGVIPHLILCLAILFSVFAFDASIVECVKLASFCLVLMFSKFHKFSLFLSGWNL